MCWMMLQKAGDTAVTRKMLHNAWTTNDDGGGFMYCVGGQLVVEKGFYKLKQFMKAYYSAHTRYGAESPFCLHFRWSTGGADTIDNVHPHWLVADKCAMAHNGILHLDTLTLEDMRSDTAYFCGTVLAYRDPAWLVGQECREWLEPMIGAMNKFIIMNGDGAYSIVNEHIGFWGQGEHSMRWFSNSGHCDKVSVSTYSAAPSGIEWVECSDGHWRRKYTGRPDWSKRYSDCGTIELANETHYIDGDEMLSEEQAEQLDEAERQREAIDAERALFSPPGEDFDSLTEMEWQSKHLEQAFDAAMMAGDDAKCRKIVEAMRELYGNDDAKLPAAYQDIL